MTVDRRKKRNLGQYLRKEREKRNISLEAVAKVTRITRENLEALEKDDFQVISAPVFVRGVLRNYAIFPGLDPKEVIARYDSQTDLVPIPQDKEPPPPPPPREEKPIFKTLLFLSILLVGVAFSFYYYQKPSGPPPAPSPYAGASRRHRGVSPIPQKTPPPKEKLKPEDGNLRALDSADGSLLWSVATLGATSDAPAMGPDGIVYVGNFAGRLLAVQGGPGGPASSAWPLLGHDARRTGRAP